MLQSEKRRSKKWFMLTLSAMLTISLLAGCGNKNKAIHSTDKAIDNSKVVAIYEGGQVTQNEFDKALSIFMLFHPYGEQYGEQLARDNQARKQILKGHILYHYLSEKASDSVKKIGHEKAKEELDKIKKQIGDKPFTEKLDKRKLTEAEVIEYIARNLTVIEDYNNKVTEEQLKVEFEKNKKDMTTASVRHILIGFKDKKGKERRKEEALKEAKKVQARLKRGEDFAKLAKQLSEDPGSAEAGGLYKDALVGQWVPQFKHAALTLPLQQISEPVETSFGYHVIRVEDRKEKEYTKLTEDEKSALRNQIASRLLGNFAQKDFEKLIEKIDLPKIETKPEKPAEKKTTVSKKDIKIESNNK